MWDSEKKLLHLKYRFAKDNESIATEEKQNSIKQKEKSTSLVSVSDIISLLETTKYHYLQYKIVFLEKIKSFYPKLNSYLNNILSIIVSKLDKAIFEWETSNNVDSFLEKVQDIFTIENDTLRKNTDSGQTVPVPRFKMVHLSLCIVLLDYLLKTDELTLYNIRSIKPLKQVQTSMKKKPVHVPSKDFNEKTVTQSKLRSYESYAMESTELLNELKTNIHEMIDHSSFLIEKVKRSQDIVVKFDKLREEPQEIFDKDDWDNFKYNQGIDYAKYVLAPLLEYDTGDGTHLSDLKTAFETILDDLETLKISDNAGSTISELDESIKYNQEQIDSLKKQETVSELSEYDVSYFTVSQFPMNMKKLLVKFSKSNENSSYGDFLNPVLEEISENLDFCYSERTDDRLRANHCKQKLEYILGISLDEKIVLYPECKLKECSITNTRGQCFDGKRLVKCRKKKKGKYTNIDDESTQNSPLMSSEIDLI